MTLNFRAIVLVPWLAYLLSISYVLLVMALKDCLRRYPRFSFYVGLLWIQAVCLLAAQAAQSAFWYYWIYVWSGPVCTLGLLSVLGEVFVEVFRPWRALPPRSVLYLFVVSTIFLVIGLGIYTMLHPLPRAANYYLTARELLDGAIGIATLIGFFAVILFADVFGIPWRNWVYGIGIGALVGAASDALFSFLPQQAVFHGLHSLCWIGAAALWSWYFAHRDSPRLTLTRPELHVLRAEVEEYGLHVRKKGPYGVSVPVPRKELLK